MKYSKHRRSRRLSKSRKSVNSQKRPKSRKLRKSQRRRKTRKISNSPKRSKRRKSRKSSKSRESMKVMKGGKVEDFNDTHVKRFNTMRDQLQALYDNTQPLESPDIDNVKKTFGELYNFYFGISQRNEEFKKTTAEHTYTVPERNVPPAITELITMNTQAEPFKKLKTRIYVAFFKNTDSYISSTKIHLIKEHLKTVSSHHKNLLINEFEKLRYVIGYPDEQQKPKIFDMDGLVNSIDVCQLVDIFHSLFFESEQYATGKANKYGFVLLPIKTERPPLLSSKPGQESSQLKFADYDTLTTDYGSVTPDRTFTPSDYEAPPGSEYGRAEIHRKPPRPTARKPEQGPPPRPTARKPEQGPPPRPTARKPEQ